MKTIDYMKAELIIAKTNVSRLEALVKEMESDVGQPECAEIEGGDASIRTYWKLINFKNTASRKRRYTRAEFCDCARTWQSQKSALMHLPVAMNFCWWLWHFKMLERACLINGDMEDVGNGELCIHSIETAEIRPEKLPVCFDSTPQGNFRKHIFAHDESDVFALPEISVENDNGLKLSIELNELIGMGIVDCLEFNQYGLSQYPA